MEKNLRLAALLITLLKWIDSSMLFFWGIFFTQLDFSGYQQGILFSIYPIVGLLTVMPIGFLNDRIASKKLIILGYGLLSIYFWGMAFSGTFFPMVLFLTLGSLGNNLIKLSADSFFYKSGDHNKTKQVGSYVGMYLLGAGLGVLVGGNILEYLPFQIWFKIVGSIAFTMMLISSKLPETETFHFEISHYRKDISNPATLIFLTMIFLWTIHMGSEMTSYGLFLRENLGLNYAQMGLFMGIAIGAMFLWTRLASKLIELKVPILKILYLGLALSGGGQILLTVGNLPLSFLGRFTHEAGDAFMFFFLYYGVRKLFPKERSGGSAGMINVVQVSANIITPLLFAPLGKLYGNGYPLMIGAAFSLLALPLAFAFSHQIKH